MELGGIHHVTAVSGDAGRNLDFYTRVLGLRLVKKTVNQDVIGTYHLFYGDEVGHPGTEMTFFEWPDAGPHRAGSGDVVATVFSVPDRSAVEWWLNRFDQLGVRHGPIVDTSAGASLSFTDPEGQRLELTVGQRPEVTPWAGSPIPLEVAIRGFAGVDLVVSRIGPTQVLLEKVLGFRQAGEYENPDGETVTVFETGPGGTGTQVRVRESRTGGHAQVGIGGVHHVAFRTPTFEQHEEWQRLLAKAGVGVTPVIDRYYFHSIYFREPGGVLFEIATDGPGFTADEDVAHLGEGLSLPPFLESQRAQIEATLPPIEPVEVS
jgi:glyoxalase family protein